MSSRIGALVVALLVLSTVVLVAAFAGGGGDGAGAAATERMAQVDGVLTLVRDDQLVLQPFTDGSLPMRFAVQPRDVPVLDLPHLRQHVQDGTPVRIFHERDATGAVARGYQDLVAP